MEGFFDHEIKDSEEFVKIYTRLVYSRNGIRGEKMIPHHRCRPEDYDDFAPPLNSFLTLFNDYRDGKRNLLCLDWDAVGEEVEIYGDPYDQTSY